MMVQDLVYADDRGQHIQAHGGGILKLGDKYYWFGEDRTRGLDPAKRYLSCYCSTNLAQWQFRRQVVRPYYVIGSALTGWSPNPNKYATAPSLSGPWSEFKDLAPPASNTYGSQSSMMVKVTGEQTTTVICVGDIWKPKTQWDSRYLWMPLEIGEGKLRLPEPAKWTLDIETGETVVLPSASGS